MKELDQQELEQSAPTLFKLKKEHNLTVPSGYFDQLPNALLKIAEKKKVVVPIYKNWTIIISVAAVLLIGLFILKPNNTIVNTAPISYNTSFNMLTAEEYETLLLIEEEDYLAEYVDFDDAEELQLFVSKLQEPLISVEVTAADFEDYFDIENEDYY